MNIQNANDRFLRLKDVQDLLHVSRSTLWRWQAEHGLKVVHVGSVTRIRESDLEVFLKRHETVSAAAPQSQAGDIQSP